MNESDLLKTLSTPGAVALALWYLSGRISRLETRIDGIADRLGMPAPLKRSRWRSNIPLMAVLLTFCGCARFVANMSETGTNGVTRTTSIRVTAIGDTKQVVDNLKLSHGKTQSIGADVGQEGTTTNALQALSALRDIVVALPK